MRQRSAYTLAVTTMPTEPSKHPLVQFSSRAKSLVERARKLALALPDTHETVSHGAPTFWVKNRTFAVATVNHHDDGRLALWCNAAPGDQADMVESDPENFFVPPYVGTRGWVGVRLDRTLSWDAIGKVIESAYHATLESRARAKVKAGVKKGVKKR